MAKAHTCVVYFYGHDMMNTIYMQERKSWTSPLWQNLLPGKMNRKTLLGHLTYVKTQQTYHPVSVYIMLTIICTILNFVYTFVEIKEWLFYICCRNGHYKENMKARITNKKRCKQRDSRKINDTCLSWTYANHFNDGHVEVEYIPTHTGHDLDHRELNYFPLPDCIKEVATKLSLGVNPSRILSGNAFYYNYYARSKQVM